jgi:cell division protease FtsH
MLKKIYILFNLITNVYCFTNIYLYNNPLKLQKYALKASYELFNQPLPDNRNIIVNIREKINSNRDENRIQNLRYSEFLSAVETDQIDKTLFYDNNKKIIAIDKENNKYKLDALPNDPDLLKILRNNNVDIAIQNDDNNLTIINYIFTYIVFGLIILTGLSILSNTNSFNSIGGMPNLLDNSKNINLNTNNNITTSFDDVMGIDNAKIELEEVVQFLKESDRFTELGAKIPRGVILEGPPGTGKTLLARAVAGEARVPFFSVSGSEFIEMFVGTGASRVRTLFETAKVLAPCIIFIDEIDAIGRQRGGVGSPNNDERDQTLNQLLTEMDGFDGNSGIIVIAATNRADILDSALLRPGRFDRRVYVDIPNLKGRKDILELYSKNKPLDDNIDLDLISRRTPGFSGADLANLMNEAAILTARNNLTKIGNNEISNALDRITLGAQKKNSVISLQKKELVAYHEAGHAIVGALTPNYDTVTKITIAPRGNAGGLTLFAPDEDRLESGLYTKDYLKSIISVALGGRIAEEIIFGEQEITTGASSDLEKVSSIARQMVTEFGMSDKIGNVFINSNDYISLDTRAIIDAEINSLVNSCYLYSKNLLLNNIDILRELAKLLIEKETITYEEFNNLINN